MKTKTLIIVGVITLVIGAAIAFHTGGCPFSDIKPCQWVCGK